MSEQKKKGGPGRGQGRHKIGEDRGGLVPVLVQVFGDQAEKMREQGNVQVFIRLAIDLAFSHHEKAMKKIKKEG